MKLPSTSPTWSKYAIMVSLFAVTVLVFGQSVLFDYVRYDDPSYVFENTYVCSGFTLDSVWWALTNSDEAIWAPLTWLSHMVDYALFGSWPGGHHLTNVLLHAINACLLFLFLKRATGKLWPSALVAALFAWHPLHVEPVAWIAARKELLCALFALSTFLAYDTYVRKPSPWRLGCAVWWFALALMAKPMAVTLPCVLLLLDYWPYGRIRFEAPIRGPFRTAVWLAVEKLSLFALVVAAASFTVLAEKEAIMPLEWRPLSERIAHVPVAYAAYLGKAVWPGALAVPYPLVPGFPPLWKLTIALSVLALGTMVFVGLWRRAPYGVVGWLWFLGVLVPVIGIIQFGHQAMADRFTYLPLIGLFVALVWGGFAIASRWTRAGKPLAVSSVIVLGVLLVFSFRQTGFWRDTGTLFSHTVEVTRDNFIAHRNLADYLTEQGRPMAALPHYERACALGTPSADSMNNYGVALLLSGRAAEAAELLAGVLQREADDPEILVNYGAALHQLGQWDAAREQAEAALRLDSDFPKARQLLEMTERESRGREG